MEEEEIKLKLSRGEGTRRTRVETSEGENRKTTEKINQVKS